MHPERQKKALVKKDMQILQQIIHKEQRSIELLQLAKKRVKNRVVLKWPQSLASPLRPTSTIDGKTVRFDIYSVSR